MNNCSVGVKIDSVSLVQAKGIILWQIFPIFKYLFAYVVMLIIMQRGRC